MRASHVAALSSQVPRLCSMHACSRPPNSRSSPCTKTELRLLFRTGTAPAKGWLSSQDHRRARHRCPEKGLGVPDDLAACQTAEIADYVVEGRVAASALRRFLSEMPAAMSLAVPGMAIGSPGMENGKAERYDAIMFGPSGPRATCDSSTTSRRADIFRRMSPASSPRSAPQACRL